MEIWKDIDGYDGYDGDYQISNQGRVKSFKRGEKIRKNKLHKSNRTNYYIINLCKNSICINYKIHHLVWDHFSDKKRNGHIIQIDHIDNNPLNNHINNLQLLNNRDNTTKSFDKTKTSSKYTGVTWDKNRNKWKSSIYYNKKLHNIGRFDDEYEAHLAHQDVIHKFNL